MSNFMNDPLRALSKANEQLKEQAKQAADQIKNNE